MSKTIVFFGTEDFSAVSLRRLIADGYSISAVITKPDSPKGRGQKLSASPVKEVAIAHGLTVWEPLKLIEIVDDLRALDQPLGVLVSYGKIIPQAVLDLFSPGIINVHPSLLPRYRGPSPIEAALLAGDPETGVTIMQLSAAMDAGPIYSQIHFPLNGDETTPELSEQLAHAGAAELSRVLPAIIDGSLEPTVQDDDAASYCPMLAKTDALITPSEMTAEQLERRVRAYQEFPKTKLTVLGQPIVILSGSVVSSAESALDLNCADNTFYRIEQLIGPTGRRLDGRAFLNGYAKN